MTARLKVIDQTHTAQDCARCPQLDKCWNLDAAPSEAALIINLLVCRLKRGIKVNVSHVPYRPHEPECPSPLEHLIREGRRCLVLD